MLDVRCFSPRGAERRRVGRAYSRAAIKNRRASLTWSRKGALGLGVNSALGLSDAFAIFNILTMLGVNTSGQERKNKLSFTGDGQYPINFEADITVSRYERYRTPHLDFAFRHRPYSTSDSERVGCGSGFQESSTVYRQPSDSSLVLAWTYDFEYSTFDSGTKRAASPILGV